MLLLALMALHFWLIRHLGIRADDSETSTFRVHATRLTGACLVVFAFLGLMALFAPENLGYRPVAGVEVTKPFWPVLWVYGLENLLGVWGMVVGPFVVFAFLAAVPLLDRGADDRPGLRGWVGWLGALLGVVVLALWLFGAFGPRQQHLGM